MADVLARLPRIVSEADLSTAELLLFEDRRVSMRYCPFDYVNRAARVVIIGITPGRQQMLLSCQEAQRALADGQVGDDVLRRVKAVGAFAGSMRTNLITMLDGIGLHRYLGVESTRALFDPESDLLHSTSAILYPAFLGGENYGGSPPPEKHPLLGAFADQVLTAELAMVPGAIIVPLGKTVAAILQRSVDLGSLQAVRVLFDFPHPSGGNGHRVRQYGERRSALASQVAGWGTSG